MSIPYLSTPHGTLGTLLEQAEEFQAWSPFNSTRYIRNVVQAVFLNKGKERLSTPHGALGTPSLSGITFLLLGLSTPHGALGTKNTGESVAG